MSANTLVDRTTVQAGAAPNAIQGLPLLLLSEQLGASVVEQDDIHLLRAFGFVQLPGAGRNAVIYCNILTRSMRREQRPEDIQVGQRRNDLLDSGDGDLHAWKGDRHQSVAFILRYCHTARTRR